VSKWISVRKNVSVPVVWVSMNPQCVHITKRVLQHDMIEEGNKYANQRLLREKLPYWDAASALRTRERCRHSADGVHVKRYVDLMRAKMLLNHLCDEAMNWKGSIDFFL